MATAPVTLVQVPPLGAPVSVISEPTHTSGMPEITEELTVTTVVTVRPHTLVYVIVAVPPATPVTVVGFDDKDTAAIVGSLVLHVPPVTASDKVVVAPAQNAEVPPLIATGSGFRSTVAEAVDVHPPYAAVTVYIVVDVIASAITLEPVLSTRNVDGLHV